ncbi:MAG TPA: hypothetical protein DHW34_04180, partial [Actinobacteria bacterium]|nr:hypothetical protein [Actinomycetota bacterium]
MEVSASRWSGLTAAARYRGRVSTPSRMAADGADLAPTIPGNRTDTARLADDFQVLSIDLEQAKWELARLKARRLVRFSDALSAPGRSLFARLGSASKALLRRGKSPARPESMAGPDPLGVQLRAIRARRDAGEVEQALTDTQALNTTFPDRPEVLDLLVGLQVATAAPQPALATSMTLDRLDGSARQRARQSRLAGNVRAESVAFVPRVRLSTPIRGSGSALVLGPGSLPNRPSVPGALIDTIEAVRGVLPCSVHHIGDLLAPTYPRGGPLDVVLQDAAAALAPRIVETDTSVVISVVTDGFVDAGPVGLSLARASRRPFIVIRVEPWKSCTALMEHADGILSVRVADSSANADPQDPRGLRVRDDLVDLVRRVLL